MIPRGILRGPGDGEAAGRVRNRHRVALALAVAVAMSIALGGCSSLRESMNGWFGASSTPAATPVTSQAGQIYYAAIDGVIVYAQPSESSQVVGHLALHERVTRTRIERGYAYIVADQNRPGGWVDNAQLLWRLPPAVAGSTPGEAEPANTVGEAPGTSGAAEAAKALDSGSAPSAQATPTSTPVTVVQPPPTQPMAPPAQAKPSRPEPSIFDPY
jgi:hypothetical protein